MEVALKVVLTVRRLCLGYAVKEKYTSRARILEGRIHLNLSCCHNIIQCDLHDTLGDLKIRTHLSAKRLYILCNNVLRDSCSTAVAWLIVDAAGGTLDFVFEKGNVWVIARGKRQHLTLFFQCIFPFEAAFQHFCLANHDAFPGRRLPGVHYGSK